MLTGSHVDTVPSGGRYDGALGVVGGLAALAALRALGTPARTLEVVALCEEESSRFSGNFFGTRAMLGLVAPDEPQRLVDVDGVTLGAAMRDAGLDPSRIAEAERHDLETFLELHVEQGRVLVDEGTDIGLVEVIPSIAWETVTVRGRQDHAGATPMDLRRDALQAAAQMARDLTRLVEQEGRPAVATTGRWTVEPGWPSIVPGLTRFSLDLRHPDRQVRDRLLGAIHDRIRAVAQDHGVEVDVVRDKDEEPAPMDAELLEVCRRAAEACGASWRRMPSGAGHDSQLMASRVPTAMVFVPSVEGRSHTPDELDLRQGLRPGRVGARDGARGARPRPLSRLRPAGARSGGGGHCSTRAGQLVAVHHAVLHDERDPSRGGDVADRVAVDDDEVGELADLDRSRSRGAARGSRPRARVAATTRLHR